jgi:hypothetical protein
MQEAPIEEPPRKAVLLNIASGACKAVSGPFTTHDTAECRRFENDGSPKDRLAKPFDPVKKPWKK